jgi:hypothetical protein
LSGLRLIKERWRGPFQKGAFLGLEPPVFLLERGGCGVVKDDIHEVLVDLWEEEGEIADAGSLDIVALEAPV